MGTIGTLSHVQLFVQPLVSEHAFLPPSSQQTFPHSFLSSASSSPGAASGQELPFRPAPGMLTRAQSADMLTNTQKSVGSEHLGFSQTDLLPRLACYAKAIDLEHTFTSQGPRTEMILSVLPRY